MSNETEDELLERLSAAPTAELPRLIEEARARGHHVTAFVCGGPRQVCYRCSLRAVRRCDAPMADHPGGVCGRPLCHDHARGTRCAQHAPQTETPNMPRPPGRR